MHNPADLYTKDRNWQAKLQLRPHVPEIDSFVRDMIAKRHDCHITKEETLKTGKDYFLNNQRYAQIIGKQLKRKFGGKLTVTRSLFSQDRQTSKAVYRVTICYRKE